MSRGRKHLPAVNWQRYYSTARVANYAGYSTSVAVCDHCGNDSSCHSQHCGTVRCIECEGA
jgi:hypothetical protein